MDSTQIEKRRLEFGRWDEMDEKKLEDFARGSTISIPARMAISGGMTFIFCMPFAGYMNAANIGKMYIPYIMLGLPAVVAILSVFWYRKVFQFMFVLLRGHHGNTRYNPETETVEHDPSVISRWLKRRREKEDGAMRDIAEAIKDEPE
jgi:hypothetical protein